MYEFTDAQFDTLVNLLMTDREFQVALNNHRRKLELKDIEYHKVTCVDDLKQEGDQQVTFQQLVDTIQDELEAKKKFQMVCMGTNTSAKFYKHQNQQHQSMEDKYEGVNALVFEDNHDYLRDLQTQIKRRYYPTNAESSKEFGDLVFPASNYLR